MLGQLTLLLEGSVADLARVGSQTCVDPQVVFHVTIFVESIIAVGTEVHGVVPLGGNIVYFFGEVYSFFTLHISDCIGFLVHLIERLGRALFLFIIITFWKCAVGLRAGLDHLRLTYYS